jgi:hypothetical protein
MMRIIEDLAGDWRRLDERIEGLSAEITEAEWEKPLRELETAKAELARREQAPVRHATAAPSNRPCAGSYREANEFPVLT